MPYPPVIRAADYAMAGPPPLVLAQPCPLHDAPECSLEEFTLHRIRGTVGGGSFRDAHADLAAGAAGRRRFAPGVDALFINWRFAGGAYVVAARLDLAYLGPAGVVPIWTKVITWAAGHCPDIGGTPFSGRLDDNAGDRDATAAQAVAIHWAPDAAFPTDHLNVQKAPYKLQMTITSVNGATVRTRTRWLYLDVEVADLTLELGPERILPARAAAGAAVDPLIGTDRRNREIRAAMAAAMGGTSLAAGDHAAIDVPLDGSLFGADSAEWDDDTFGRAWQARWGDGPYVPIVARVRVFDEAGHRVPARLALGGARFLWDWEGADLDVGHVHALSRDAMRGAYGINAGQWRTGGQNTVRDVGGKRGAGAALFRHGDLGYQTYANGGARLFPFRMAPCGTRRGAIWSFARTTDDDYGSYTGAVFTPSCIAQDRFTLTVYFAYGAEAGWDVDSTADALRHALPYPVPSIASGQMTVQRVVRISRWWRHNNSATAGTFTWAHVAGDLQQAGIALDAAAVAAPTDIPAVRFRALFAAELARLPAAERSYFAPQAEQAEAGRGYGLKLRPFDQMAIDVLARYRARVAGAHHAQLGGADPNAFDRIEARAEMYLQLSGQTALYPAVNNTITALGLPQVWGTTAAISAWMDPQLQMLLPAANADAAATAIVTDPLPDGDPAAVTALIRLAGLTADSYRDTANGVANRLLTAICGAISSQDAPDEDGLQVFQFDFEDNFDQFSASGWAFDTPSNRTHCPECNTALANGDRAARLCPNAGCAQRLRSSASIMTLVPWRHMGGFQAGVFAQLQANKAKYFVLTNMAGTRPEILVVHEMGHHLCLPHSPHGFNVPDPVPGGAFWLMLSTAVNHNAGVRRQLVDGTVPGGNRDYYHADAHRACIMGYNFAEMANLHYCFKCALRLRGWDGDYVRVL